MSPCPSCGREGAHVAATFPLEDMQGEIRVLHRCDNGCLHGDGTAFSWDESGHEPLRLLARALKLQANLASALKTLEAR